MRNTDVKFCVLSCALRFLSWVSIAVFEQTPNPKPYFRLLALEPASLHGIELQVTIKTGNTALRKGQR
jgi:hypothetical protein